MDLITLEDCIDHEVVECPKCGEIWEDNTLACPYCKVTWQQLEDEMRKAHIGFQPFRGT